MPEIVKDIVDFFKNAGTKLLLGVVVLLLGLLIIKLIIWIMRIILKKSSRDGSVISFIVSITDIALKILLLIIALNTMDVNSTSLIAVISTCGVAIGLALKDSLGNVAGGIIIIFNKPFKEGDFIDVSGVTGKVVSINVFCTTLCTSDNKKVVVPNSGIANGTLINYNARPTRRVDLVFDVAYGSDMKKVKEILLKITADHPLVLKQPEPSVRMKSHSESSVKFDMKVWTATASYWDVYYDITEEVYDKFLENRISIPFPQLDVHIRKEENNDEEA